MPSRPFEGCPVERSPRERPLAFDPASEIPDVTVCAVRLEPVR